MQSNVERRRLHKPWLGTQTLHAEFPLNVQGYVKLHIPARKCIFFFLFGQMAEKFLQYVHNTLVRINCLCMKLAIRKCAYQHVKGKGKAVPLQAWSGPEGSRKLRFPDFMTTAQDGGMHNHPLYLCCPDALSLVGDPLSGNECGSPNHI